MQNLDPDSWPNSKRSLSNKTIWSRGTEELIPERFRRIITVVMPLIYGNLAVFGFLSALYPAPTFATVVGVGYGTIWAIMVTTAALVSFLTLVFRSRIEIYSSLILTILLGIYPFYVAFIIFHDPDTWNVYKLAVIFAVTLYPIMPAWRVVDIVLEIRKSRQRQLYAAANKGET